MQTTTDGDGIANIITPDTEDGFRSSVPADPNVPKAKARETGVNRRPKEEGGSDRKKLRKSLK